MYRYSVRSIILSKWVTIFKFRWDFHTTFQYSFYTIILLIHLSVCWSALIQLVLALYLLIDPACPINDLSIYCLCSRGNKFGTLSIGQIFLVISNFLICFGTISIQILNWWIIYDFWCSIFWGIKEKSNLLGQDWAGTKN